MTYLQLINKVLRELREPQVTVLTADYTAMIGQYVNKAKDMVEDSWRWKCLRSTLTFNTAASTRSYNLGTAGVASGGTTTERSHLLYDECGQPQVYSTTLKTQMTEYPSELLAGQIILNQMQNAQPSWFYQSRSNAGITLVFDPPPNAIYAMAARFWIPQADLSLTTDVVTVPSKPVWTLALAYAASERSGGQGEAVKKLEDQADRALGDAIEMDTDTGELDVTPG